MLPGGVTSESVVSVEGSGSTFSNSSWVSPVSILAIRTALALSLAGRFSPCGPTGISPPDLSLWFTLALDTELAQHYLG